MLAVIGSISKTEEWRDYVSQGAPTFTLDKVQALFRADTLTQTGNTDLRAVRNKLVAIMMIIFGWHPIDAWKLHEDLVEDRPNHRDREGCHRPKILILGHNTKRKGIKVANVLGCGCAKEHDWGDKKCLYNLARQYMVVKTAADWMFLNGPGGVCKFNKDQKKIHLDGSGNLKRTFFFRSFSEATRTYIHSRMGDKEIRNVFKYRVEKRSFLNVDAPRASAHDSVYW